MRTRTFLIAVLALGACRSERGAGVVSGDPCASAIFCDDFESYDGDGQPAGNWMVKTNMGAVAIDATRARSGTKSVRLTTQAKTTDGGKTAFIRLSNPSLLPVAGNVIYGRMMVYLDSVPATSVHWTLLEGSGLVAGQSYHALYRYGGQLPVVGADGTTLIGSQLMANYETPDSYPIGSGVGPGSDCWHHGNKTIAPVGRWACVEWKFDGPKNQMSLWIDGAALPDLTVTGTGDGCVNAAADFTWTAPAFDRIDLGWESYQADDARTVWIDDVAIATAQIGCPQ